MGSLLLGTLLLSLIGKAVKSVKASGTQAKVSKTISGQVARINSRTKTKTPKAIARQDIRKIYIEQKKSVQAESEVKTHTAYIVASTTVLGKYLADDDWNALAQNTFGENELMERLEQNYDADVHTRLSRAAQKVGFVNIRRQIPTGTQQVASFSDGRGHGVRIAISHGDESRIGLDLVGYQGNDCHTKSEELVAALKNEGLHVAKINKVNHGDPRGCCVRETSKHKSAHRRQQRLKGQQQKLRRV